MWCVQQQATQVLTQPPAHKAMRQKTSCMAESNRSPVIAYKTVTADHNARGTRQGTRKRKEATKRGGGTLEGKLRQFLCGPVQNKATSPYTRQYIIQTTPACKQTCRHKDQHTNRCAYGTRTLDFRAHKAKQHTITLSKHRASLIRQILFANASRSCCEVLT